MIIHYEKNSQLLSEECTSGVFKMGQVVTCSVKYSLEKYTNYDDFCLNATTSIEKNHHFFMKRGCTYYKSSTGPGSFIQFVFDINRYDEALSFVEGAFTLDEILEIKKEMRDYKIELLFD